MLSTDAQKALEPDAVVSKTLRRIRRRVFADRLLRNGAVDLTAAAAIAALVVVVDRIAVPGAMSLAVLGGLAAGAVLVSLVRTLIWSRLSLFRVAVLADDRLELKERVSSAVYLGGRPARPPEEAREEAEREEVRALIAADAARGLQGAPVTERFPVRPPRAAVWSLVPSALAIAFWLWLPAFDILHLGRRQEAIAKEEKAVEDQKKKLEDRLADMAKLAKDKDLPDAKKVLELIAQAAQNMEKKDPSAAQNPEKASGDPRKEALAEMTRREDALKKGLDGQKLEPLKDAKEAFKTLDLKQAELTRKLQEALKDGKFDDAKKQLDDLKNELSKLAQKSPSELTAEEKKKLEQLSSELSKLAKDSKALSKFSSSLSKASSQLSSQDMPSALDSLSSSGDDLESLSKLASEMDMLEQALQLVELSKDELANLPQVCPQCGTPYCPDCGKPQCSCKPGTKPGGT